MDWTSYDRISRLWRDAYIIDKDGVKRVPEMKCTHGYEASEFTKLP